MPAPMNLNVGDVVQTRKQHPCGNDIWKIIRIGADIKIKCALCNHIVMIERSEFEKRVRKMIEHAGGSYE